MPETTKKAAKKATTKKATTKKATTKKATAKKAAAKATPARSTTRTGAKTQTVKKAASRAKLHVKQVRSEIGHAGTYRQTLRALGLRHYQHEVTIADNASMRGMLHKVRHLVRVTPEEA